MITFKRISKIRTPCYFYYSTKQEPNPKKPENEQLLKTPDAPNTSESNAPKQKPKPKFQLNILKWYLDNAQTPGQLLVKKDIQRGNLWEIHEYAKSRRTKLEHLQPSLIKERLPFPEILSKGTNLLGEKLDLSKEFSKNKASVVFVTQKRIISGFMVDSWRKPLREKFKDAPIYEIMVPMNVGYSLLNPYVNYNLKKEYSDEERKNMMYTSFLHRTKIDPVDIGVNIENSLFAYIFLLDSKGNVLWKAVGESTPESLSDLFKYYEKILQLKENNVEIGYTDKNSKKIEQLKQDKKNGSPNSKE